MIFPQCLNSLPNYLGLDPWSTCFLFGCGLSSHFTYCWPNKFHQNPHPAKSKGSLYTGVHNFTSCFIDPALQWPLKLHGAFLTSCTTLHHTPDWFQWVRAHHVFHFTGIFPALLHFAHVLIGTYMLLSLVTWFPSSVYKKESYSPFLQILCASSMQACLYFQPHCGHLRLCLVTPRAILLLFQLFHTLHFFRKLW